MKGLLTCVLVSNTVVILSLRIAYMKKNGAHAEQSGCAPYAYKKLRVKF